MRPLLLATRNRHKAREIAAILGPDVPCLTLNDFPDAPPLVEDAATFADNATRKAAQLAQWLSDLPPERGPHPACRILADDSGLEVDALGGAPGVHSARFAALDRGAAANSSDAENNAKLLRLLAGVPWEKRTARFRCVLALMEPPAPGASGVPRLFEGVCEGHIGFAPRGTGGFGYDPLFFPAGSPLSFAELEAAVKNQLSHRARALAKLRDHLRTTP